MTVNLFLAPTEELAFRGLFLERFGLVVSSLAFGGMHLANLLVVGTSSFDAVWSVSVQTLYTTSLGFYLGYVTMRNGYDIRKAVAIHYWNNVFAYVVPFMERGGGSLGGAAPTKSSSTPALLSGLTLGITLPL
jgi:membrane protease YdiL (CAAX protease family)